MMSCIIATTIMTNKPNPSLELPPLALPLCMGELWMVSLSSRRWKEEL